MCCTFCSDVFRQKQTRALGYTNFTPLVGCITKGQVSFDRCRPFAGSAFLLSILFLSSFVYPCVLPKQLCSSLFLCRFLKVGGCFGNNDQARLVQRFQSKSNSGNQHFLCCYPAFCIVFLSCLGLPISFHFILVHGKGSVHFKLLHVIREPLCAYSDPLPTCVLRQALRGYALILTHPGVPCVFYWDYVGPLSPEESLVGRPALPCSCLADPHPVHILHTFHTVDM